MAGGSVRLKAWGAVAGAVVLGVTGCVRAPAPRSAAGFNLLLVTLDTVRADHIGAWGYRAAETPNLDRLAAAGVRFAEAESPVPLTLPSHATILSGLLPPRPRPAQQRHRALPGGARHARHAARGGRLPDRRVHRGVRARPPLRPGPRLRALRRRHPPGRHRGARCRAPRPGGRRSGAGLARRGRDQAVLRLGAPLRRPRPVRPARALPDEVCGSSVRRRDRRGGRAARPPARRSRPARARRHDGRRGRGRPRRGARRPRRTHPRPAALRAEPPRPADRAGAGRTPRRLGREGAGEPGGSRPDARGPARAPARGSAGPAFGRARPLDHAPAPARAGRDRPLRRVDVRHQLRVEPGHGDQARRSQVHRGAAPGALRPGFATPASLPT